LVGVEEVLGGRPAVEMCTAPAELVRTITSRPAKVGILALVVAGGDLARELGDGGVHPGSE
jgi:hypothetical protein